jgi:tousled-like kinase
MRGNDGTDQNLSLQGKDPGSSIGLGNSIDSPACGHRNHTDSASISQVQSQATPTKGGINPDRRYVDEAYVRQEMEKEIREEYEQDREKMTEFFLDYVSKYTILQSEMDSIELLKSQERLGTITTIISGATKWIGGLEVERTDRKIEILNRKLELLKEGAKKEDKAKPNLVMAQLRASLGLELKELRQYRKQLDEERHALVIRMRIAGDRGQSEFRENQKLNDNRYVLIKYLGRGGFSEVWLAFDLTDVRHVALKIQRMNPQWSREIQADFVRHSGREIKILSSTKHENVVNFYGHFYIGDDTVALVEEYCSGGDLSELIRKRGRIQEKEARIILIQILQGLLALRMEEGSVIHYDLKPGNILFDEHGVVKITDFGLSKIIESDERDAELTSQGTGTYYYAAPETLQRGRPVKITSNVDSWSLGIIYYELLYGQRPFGEDLTQQSFALQLDSLVGKLVFPPAGKVSESGKNFILACLDRDPMTRPGLEALWELEYIQKPEVLKL